MKRISFFFEVPLLIIVPALLFFIELFHPADIKDHVYHYLYSMRNVWLGIHYSQSFLFGLMAIAVYYLTRKYNNDVLVWLMRVSLFIFLITYTVLDAVGGIAIGRLLTYIQTYGVKEETIKEIVQLLFNDPVAGGMHSIYSLTGSYTWLIAIVLTVIVMTIKLPRTVFFQAIPALTLLLISGFFLCISHGYPYGPIAFGAFSLAGIWWLYLKNRSIMSNQSFFF